MTERISMTVGEKITNMKAPWGEFQLDTGDYLATTVFLIKQLEWYLDHRLSPNPKETQDDLKGYRLLLQTNDNEVAETFYALKNAARGEGMKIGNLEVIEQMKRKGRWKNRLQLVK